MITICYILIGMQETMQETEELFAEFQISLKILEKLSERNIELMG